MLQLGGKRAEMFHIRSMKRLVQRLRLKWRISGMNGGIRAVCALLVLTVRH